MLIPSTGFWMGWLKGMSHRLITPGTLFRRLYSWQNEGRSEQKYALVCQKPSHRFASTTRQNCENALILQKCVLKRYWGSSSHRDYTRSLAACFKLYVTNCFSVCFARLMSIRRSKVR